MKSFATWAVTAICYAMTASVVSSLADTFTNPIIWQDFPDIDVFRVHDTFYYSASTMHYSPGAPILRSYDLVDWELVGHSAPSLAFGDDYDLKDGKEAYNNGIWASSMRYRESNGLWYWYGCVDSGLTYIYTASDPTGDWKQAGSLSKCYYDLGIFIDKSDTMFLVYGSATISLVQLSEDGMSAVQDEVVYHNDGRYIEGSRMYEKDGSFYIWLTKPPDEQHVLKSSSIWGPYTSYPVLDKMASPVPHSGTPHQGALVDTPNGDWYYVAFLDAFPLGRIPVLAPIKWNDEGLPSVVTNCSGGWGTSYPKPDIKTNKTVTPIGRPFVDSFSGDRLHPRWEWNHNPNNTGWSLANPGLNLSTVTVCTGLYEARNTLTTRSLGPRSEGTFVLNLGDMGKGDIAGAALIRDRSAYIGAHKSMDGSVTIKVVTNITMQGLDNNWVDWETTSEGIEVASVTEGLEGVADGSADLWLRVIANVAPSFNSDNSDNIAVFQYSTDGDTFHDVLGNLLLQNSWQFFMGYRFSVFNFATSTLGGSVLVKQFDMTSEH